MKTVLTSIAIGIVVTLILLASAFGFDAIGYPQVSRIVFWQNDLLQSLVPLHNIGTEEQPVYEGTPLNYLAFLASIPFGFVVYGLGAYGLLKIKHKST